MKHTIVTFRLHRRGVILLALGSILLGALLFAAGCLAGMRRAERTAAAAPAIPAPPAPLKPKPPEAPKDEQVEEAYALRVGTFADEAEAKTFADELAAAGQKPAISPMPTSGGVMLHAVSVGPYPSRDAASEAATGLARRGISAVIVPMAP